MLNRSCENQTAKPGSFLRWAGSKRQQIPVLSAIWNPTYRRYIEPFMGSACLFFHLQPKRAILTDINTNLVRTFIAVRDHPRAVWNRLSKIPLGKLSYYSIRRSRLQDLDDLDAAANFIFLNRFCFNGLYRTNQKGIFNVPFGSSDIGRLPYAFELQAASRSLRNCKIIASDFEVVLRKAQAGDFVYLDPPYAVGNRRVFRQYDPSSFGLQDIYRLAQSLTDLDRKEVAFVLSYAYCKEALEFFRDWPQRRFFVQRNIAGFATNRRRAAELLVSNCFPERFLIGKEIEDSCN